MTSHSFRLSPATGRPLEGILDLPSGPGPHPTVVICHGFKGFLEWGFFPPLAELLAQRGFAAVRFNLSGAGMRPGDELVTDPEAFRTNTYTKELEDLLAVLEVLGSAIGPERLDLDRLGLVGHSRGGAASLLAAASDAWRDRVKALVTWAAIARVDRFSEDQMALWRKIGDFPVANARTGQELALGPAMREEIEARPAHLDLLAAAGRRRAPWLIVHGREDESVPFREAGELAGAATGTTQLLAIEGGNHTFGAKHPFAGPTPQLIEAMNATQTWLKRYLG
ncbi:MAG TPA: alpha/beta fold hydrolase [Thermoanaerobaculia bacterium]|nr:alpha/beta fold hydrolase [Thermoanaerobaculia bacterium]